MWSASSQVADSCLATYANWRKRTISRQTTPATTVRRPLTRRDSLTIDGPVLISAGILSGFEYGPGRLNPCAQFQDLRPSAAIEHGVFVYDGHFEIPLAAAHGYVQRANDLLAAKDAGQAVTAAKEAVRLAPDLADAQSALAAALAAAGRAQEARSALEKAVVLAKTVEPEFQEGKAARLDRELWKLGK